MKKGKGFTLIELLAVIVVLGIVMTIAVASVSRILEKTKKDAFLASAYAFIEAVRHRVALGEVVLPYKLDDWEEVYLDKTMLEKGTKSPYGNS